MKSPTELAAEHAVNLANQLGKPAANVLPIEARLALQSAVKTADPFERCKTLAKATARVKRQYPRFFK